MALALLAFPAAGQPLPTSGAEPPPKLEDWNYDGKTPDLKKAMERNNCYNYACNKRTDTFAQPGRAGGKALDADGDGKITCDEVLAAAKADGLGGPVDCDKACPAGSYKKAVVVGNLSRDGALVQEGADYHWYRQNNDGQWTHKPGSTEATNKDGQGRPITDPRTADRTSTWKVRDATGEHTMKLDYDRFCGCLCCSTAAGAVQKR